MAKLSNAARKALVDHVRAQQQQSCPLDYGALLRHELTYGPLSHADLGLVRLTDGFVAQLGGESFPLPGSVSWLSLGLLLLPIESRDAYFSQNA